MNRVYENFDRVNQADNEEALAALGNTGVDFVEPVQGAIDRWREPVMAANRSLAEEGYLSPELLDEVLALLAEYRAQAAPTAQAGGDSP
jgi:hypothetical protein